MRHISRQEIFELHESLIKRYGGCSGCADPDKINALLSRVFNYAYYDGVEDVFALAAMYFVAIARGHVFVDGNKRTALAVCLLFLKRNNVSIHHVPSLEQMAVDVAQGLVSASDLANYLRKNYSN